MRRAIWTLVTGSLVVLGLLMFNRLAASELTYRPVLPPWPGVHARLEVLVGGQPLRTIAHAGKTYLPVPELGTEYEIRVSNHGPRRITAIVSVDGLSVINGKPASESHPGYIVDPGSSIRIKGWRRNMESVAAFRFEERAKSYAALMGWPENVGVIGLVAIEEMSWRNHLGLENKDAAAPATKRAAESGSIGTGYGRDIDSSVTSVPFVRGPSRQSLTIWYDTTDALRRAGVPVDRPYPVPFPGDTEFVPPPPGHRER